MTTNLIRYPFLTFVPSFAVVVGVYKDISLYFVVEAMIIIVLLALIFINIPGSRQKMKSDRSIVNIYILLLLLYWATLLPTLHLFVPWADNSAGRHLYIPTPWIAIACSIFLLSMFPFRPRIAVLAIVTSLYLIIGRYSSEGFYYAGRVSDQLIDDYYQYCVNHPNEKPFVISTVADVQGDVSLFLGGLHDAVIYKHLNVPLPNHPIVQISEFSRCDSIYSVRVNDSTIRITDASPLSWVGIRKDVYTEKFIANIVYEKHNSVEFCDSRNLFETKNNPMLVVYNNSLVLLDSVKQ